MRFGHYVKALYIFFVINVLLINSLLSQITISGSVKDNKQKMLAGVSITLVDTYDGATSSEKGTFSFKTTEKGKFFLEFTVTGYNSYKEEIDITDKNIVIDAVMKEQVTELNAVTITAGSFEASDKKKEQF